MAKNTGAVTVEYIQHMGDDEMIAKAARVSTGNDKESQEKIKGLIGYLAREDHTSPFEHTALTVRVEAPIFIAREVMRHRTFCISGDTEITFGSQSPTTGKISMIKKTIAEHWEHWHEGVPDSMGRRRVLPSVKSARVVSLDEDTKQWVLQPVVDVIKSGVKPVYRLTTERGFSVKATDLHRFLTPEGWRKLGELKPNDMVYVQQKGYKKTKAKVPRNLRTAINSWSGQYYANILEKQHGFCAQCAGAVEGGVVDHKIPVALDLKQALDEENLQVLCKKCDRGKTNEEQKIADRTGAYEKVSGERIVSIDYVGEEMTYDLSVAEPHHNFLANGIVVHNSYNELSARYAEMEQVAYTPGVDRPLKNAGSGAHPKLEVTGYEDTELWTDAVLTQHYKAYDAAFEAYREMLDAGVATEVARSVLPVGTYTSWYMTGNLLNWFRFLELRDGRKGHPQVEITWLAEEVWKIIQKLWPVACEAWLNKVK